MIFNTFANCLIILMKKYKQTIIPEVTTKEWVTLTRPELRERLLKECRDRYYGKKIINQDLGITVEFEMEGARKTSYGSAAYSKKACLIMVLDKLIRYAEFTNWGSPKTTDPSYVIGFLNFKAKVKIDDKLEHVHLVVRVRNTGKFHYVMEVNKIKNR
jgi:hypothetical protein